jgi:hypothetical protein
MHGLYIEQRSLNGKTLLSWDLAHHMYARGTQGKVAIVTDKPAELLSATRKQWYKIMRQVQRERSSTLDVIRIGELSRQAAWMQNLTFSAKVADDVLEADVTFALADDFLRISPLCSTLYATYPFAREKLHMLASWMPKNGVVVEYI